jgi:hypothetical protein
MGIRKRVVSDPPPAVQMSIDEAKTAIMKYKGETFPGISALVTKINQETHRHAVNGVPRQVVHSVARQALTALAVTSTGSFTVPREK